MAEQVELPDSPSADDIALMAAVATIVGDVLALIALLKARNEKEEPPPPISRKRQSEKRTGG
ncbi:hypothetical protein [Paenibacillus sp. MMS18-CY102]|uniref:hypothetical protein n=1 Tax=Paenibacillus sp. MMS18-CY102 TaxID=2682849 RepID=UPI001365547B|nr:hypothetical protein [Paenibacillus sp. MMS18-CY102]MWC31017.1 hypothetical protein [Paenibacillus sp. MMS18-CY102]